MKPIIAIIVLFFMGCEPVTKEPPSREALYFDVAGFSKDLLIKQVEANTNVIKTTAVTGIHERLEVEKADSTFWVVELSSLLQTNLKNPSLKGSFNISKGLEDTHSNLLITKYALLPEVNFNLKKLEIKYLGTTNNIRELIATFRTQNSVYSTHQTVQLWINRYGNGLQIDSMLIKGYNKTILLDTMYYQSKVVVVN